MNMGDLVEEFLNELEAFLGRPEIALLFELHPNATVTPNFTPPESWQSWWDWSGEISHDASATVEPKWRLLWQFYAHESPSEEASFTDIPQTLREYLRHTRRLQLTRAQGLEATVPEHQLHDAYTPTSKTFPRAGNLHGMSPKKTHEVQYMSAYASNLLSDLAARGTTIRHAVDVGAGQVSRNSRRIY